MQYHVKSSKYLCTIIYHFNKYPLIIQKQADYELFKQAVKLFNNKAKGPLHSFEGVGPLQRALRARRSFNKRGIRRNSSYKNKFFKISLIFIICKT
jgi:hypothetical protein